VIVRKRKNGFDDFRLYASLKIFFVVAATEVARECIRSRAAYQSHGKRHAICTYWWYLSLPVVWQMGEKLREVTHFSFTDHPVCNSDHLGERMFVMMVNI